MIKLNITNKLAVVIIGGIISLAICLGIYFGGVLGLVWFYGMTEVLLMGYKLSFIKRLIKLDYMVFVKNLFNPIFFSTLMYLVVILVHIMLDDYIEIQGILLLIESIVGALVYIALSYFFDHSFSMGILKSKFRK